MTAQDVLNQGLVQYNTMFGWATVPVTSQGFARIGGDVIALVRSDRPDEFRRPSDEDVLRFRQRELERSGA